MADDAAILPADIEKTVINKAEYSAVQPRKGDEVSIQYVATKADDGSTFDATLPGKPFVFKLGVGQVMEGWDRAIATMKNGEKARFTLPEIYLMGGAPELLDKIPDDSTVIYEMELVRVRKIDDLFEDGGVIQTIEKQEDMYGRSPKVGDEVALSYDLCIGDKVVEKRPTFEYKIGHGTSDNMIPGKVLDKCLLGIKRLWEVSLQCRSDYAFGDAGCEALGVVSGTTIVLRLSLQEIYEVEDAGKKIGWPEFLVVKKAIKVVNQRLVPGMDGTKCKIKLLSGKRGEEELASEQVLECVPGDGDLCDALECACSRMRKGEIAIVTARGDTSLFSPGKPNITADGTVTFHVEMLDFDRPPSEDGPSGDSERLRFCTDQKDRGSTHFRQGRFRLALERYSRVLALLPRYKRDGSSSLHVDLFQHESDREKAQELRTICRLNLAACALKLEEFYTAVRNCDAVLKDDSKNLKALYRRAQAYVGTKEFEDASKDCKRILELEAGHKEAQLLLRKIAQQKKEEAQKQRAQFAGKF
eukprot:CAMPEP_0169070892 /NCGR_PEP_ID=MMETSP1015-20121227/5366_1 /TAXON_ID=342587 /ORGANISM="Karlodinium micrum, Strain CCMP2283" /LENGTH=528 /DNA_ID=CAMNT_0009129937 /DNA_START=61 /DNA_END=1647 /DNA_ORIENTATION=-